jgi:hypothetical protein
VKSDIQSFLRNPGLGAIATAGTATLERTKGATWQMKDVQKPNKKTT